MKKENKPKSFLPNSRVWAALESWCKYTTVNTPTGNNQICLGSNFEFPKSLFLIFNEIFGENVNTIFFSKKSFLHNKQKILCI